MESFNYLLKDNRVNPGAHENLAIIKGAENGNLEMVGILLNTEDRKIIPSARESAVLLEACKGNYYDVIRLLLESGRVSAINQ